MNKNWKSSFKIVRYCLQARRGMRKRKTNCFVIFVCFAFGCILLKTRRYGHGENYKLKNLTKNWHGIEDSKSYSIERNRTFLYLIQGPSCLPEHLKGEQQVGCGSICDYDVLMLGFRQKCPGPPLEHVEYIHMNGTTWNTGRNHLYEYAMNRTRKYLYYIFMDEDITLKPNDNSDSDIISYGPWRAFERFLKTYKPAIASTSYCWSTDASCKLKEVPKIHVIKGYIFDASFNAIHYDALPYLLPYHLKGENESWWYSQHYMTLLARYYFKDFVLVYTQVNTVNVQHRKYPKKDATKKKLTAFEKEVENIIKQRNRNPPEWKGMKIFNVANPFCKC